MDEKKQNPVQRDKNGKPTGRRLSAGAKPGMKAGFGKAGFGKAGFGKNGTGKAGFEKAGAEKNGAGKAGAGQTGVAEKTGRKPGAKPVPDGSKIRNSHGTDPTGRPKAAGTEERKPHGEHRTGGERNSRGPRPYGKSGNMHIRTAPEKERNRGPAAKRTAGPAEMEGLASRRAALAVIRAVTEKGAYASLTLDSVLRNSGLSAADRRLASRLAYDTLDRLIWLDHALGQVMAREDTDIKLRNILRLGACQILVEDRIPESAATNTAVQLCTELGMEGLKGVCNGILRNLVRMKDQLEYPEPGTDAFFALEQSLPEWLWVRLHRDYGEQAAAIASYRASEESIVIRRNLLRETPESFEKILEGKVWTREKSVLPDAWRIRGAMDIGNDADFLRGAFSIQSESSMMAVLALAPRRGQQILDCCAAPGGKTCLIAEMMGGTGRVQAWDIHGHRVDLITAQAKRLGLENIRPIVRDAVKYRENLLETMDGVLLDAPCSGLGVLAEKPDIKLRLSEESLRELTELQAKLLDTVCRYVKRGGLLVYSTCSLLRDENEGQAEAFLARHPEFEAEPLPETIPEQFRRYAEKGLQLIPRRDGVEGFYICRMRKKR